MGTRTVENQKIQKLKDKSENSTYNKREQKQVDKI